MRGYKVLVVVLTGLVVVSSVAAVGSPTLDRQSLVTQSGPVALSSGERLNSTASNRSSHTSTAGWIMARANAANTNQINTTGPTNPITTRWTFATDAETFGAGPVVANGTVYFGTQFHGRQEGDTNEGTLYAVDAWTGEKRWTFRAPSGNYPDHLAVLRDTVYVGTYNGKVYALDAATGEKFWTFRTEGRPTGLTVADRTLYVTSKGTAVGTVPDGRVYALGALRGEEQWSFTTDGPARGPPAVKDGTVYVSARYGNVYALDDETGAVNWNVIIGDGERKRPPSVANGIVYVGGSHSNLYALDAETGNNRWNHHPEKAGAIASPSVLGNTVYYSGDYLHAVDAQTGTDRWTVRDLKGTPMLLNDIAYIRGGRTLYTLNPATGAHNAHFTNPKEGASFQLGMAVLNGSLYTGYGFDEPRTFYDSDHTAFYALGTPEFTYSNLSVTPRSPEVNESVTATVTVRNTGTGPGEFNSTLLVNGNVTNATTARLDPRTSQTVTFAHTFATNGTYTVEIAGLTRQISVGDVEPAPTPSPTPTPAGAGDAPSPTSTESEGETVTPTGSDSTLTPTATSGTVPGFGVGGWVAAVALMAVLVGLHKRD